MMYDSYTSSVIHHSLNETIGRGGMGGSPDHRLMLLFYLDGWITLTLLNFQLDFKWNGAVFLATGWSFYSRLRYWNNDSLWWLKF